MKTFWKRPALWAAVLMMGGWGVTDRAGAETAGKDGDDPYLWLEEVEGEKALDWVRAQNKETLAVLEEDPRYQTFYDQAYEVLAAKDRIAYGTYRAGHVYNFWQDETHVRGLWRRTTLESYKSDTPEWDVLLDIDKLAEAEDENWVFQGADCLAPDYTRCLLTLSRGGSDAATVREFDIESRSFVEGGFALPEAKSRVTWIDRDTVFVGTDFGEGSLTTSGYPRLVKRWSRGQALEDAETVFEGEAGDVSVTGFTIFRPEGNLKLVVKSPSFFERDYYIVRDSGELVQVPVPADMNIEGLFAGQVLMQPQRDWTVGETTYAAGTLLSMELAAFLETGELPEITTVYEPDARTSIQGVSASKSYVMVSLLQNVTAVMKRLTYEGGAWAMTDIPIPENGTASISSLNAFNDTVFVNYENYVTPDTLYQLDVEDLELTALKSLPERFNAEGLTTQQFEATSADGTKIPYFIVHKADIELDGTNPVLQYGYGGFRISLTPSYSGVTGKNWLERGGVYVVANIRGGDEFGPAWHEAALKLNRQRAYDDFIAVSEDLIARKITSPRNLSIYGGSNGGLLVGVAFTQRPDLYNGVVCAVPLLDMLRYHKLLAGASWMGEYGNPDVPEERAAIEEYSPYQNLKKDTEYPRVFFQTSTKDDRVHPGHARKMAARMIEYGNPVYYYENIEGGHSAAANLKQSAHRLALMYVYLSRQLMDEDAE